MTKNIEEKFFKTFDIEPHLRYTVKNCACGCHDCENCERYKEKFSKVYPELTDRRLLELICVALNTFETFEVNRLMNIDSLKEKILELLMLAQDDVYKEVQTVFKEK